MTKWIVRSSLATLPLAALGAFYHRPVPDLTEASWGGPSHYNHKVPTDEELGVPAFSAHATQWKQWLRVKKERLKQRIGVRTKKTDRLNTATAASNITEDEDYPHLQNDECLYADDRGTNMSTESKATTTLVSLITSSGRYLATFYVQSIINFVIHVGMNYYNNFEVIEDTHYDSLISTIRSRDPDIGLITVSNHGSTIDDPTLFGSMLPFDLAMDPSKLRWTLCSQEICFKNPAVAALLGAGNVLPIRRGGGVDQPLLLNLARKVAQGGWIHLFPEGKIVQSGDLGSNYFGTRSKERADDIGKLKWGVGKIIAHAPVAPVVIPFHHIGMEGVVPQEITGECKDFFPFGGNHARVRVGQQLCFDDIIADHETRHGALRKYSSNKKDSDRRSGRSSGWQSSADELLLYSRITLRIEQALLQLESDSKNDADHRIQDAYSRLLKS
jgi:monolysocardiolipin acyltransferase